MNKMDFYEIMLQQKLSGGGGSGGDTEVWLVGSEYQDQGGMRMFTLSVTSIPRRLSTCW